MFTHLEKVTPATLKVQNTPKGRFYTTPTGNSYPSITTLLGAKEKPWLEDWRQSLGVDRADKETKRAADRGEAVHAMIEKYLANNPNPTENHIPEHIGEFNSMRLKLKPVNNIYMQEAALYSDTLKVAGRVDCVAEWNGVLSIVDFKTSTNDKYKSMIEDYFLQTTAYAIMVEEMYNIPIDQIVILMSVEKGIIPLVYKEKVDNWIEPLVSRINTYYNSKK